MTLGISVLNNKCPLYIKTQNYHLKYPNVNCKCHNVNELTL